MKSFIVGSNDATLRLDKFIAKNIPALPKSLMYKYIRTKDIKVNGKRAEISTRLNVGDRVDAYIKDEFLAPVEKQYDFLRASKQLKIVYEDENILLADKPQGVLSHPDDTHAQDQ